MPLHLDMSSLIVAVLTWLVGMAVYYVRTQVALGGTPKIAQATSEMTAKLEKIAGEVMTKMDGLRDSLNAVNVTLGRSDERHTQAERALDRHEEKLDRHDERITNIERRHAA